MSLQPPAGRRRSLLLRLGPSRAHFRCQGFAGGHNRRRPKPRALTGCVPPALAPAGQRFVVDLTMNAHLQMAGQADALECSVDYSAVYLCVQPMTRHIRVSAVVPSQQRGAQAKVEPTPCFSVVRSLVKKTVEGQRRQLIEAVAEDIARAVLRYSARVESVAVTVKKPHVAVPGQVDFLGVQIPGHHCSSHTTVASS